MGWGWEETPLCRFSACDLGPSGHHAASVYPESSYLPYRSSAGAWACGQSSLHSTDHQDKFWGWG